MQLRTIWQTTHGKILLVLFFPLVLIWYVWTKTKIKIPIKVAFTVLVLTVVALPIMSISPQTQNNIITDNKSSNNQLNGQATLKPYKYETIHSLQKSRYDGGDRLYILIPEVDLEDPALKLKITDTIKTIRTNPEQKISIEIFDNLESLNLSYKQFVEMTLNRPRTEAENNSMARHYIASYQGKLRTNSTNNTVDFFPASDSANAQVGALVSSEKLKN